MTGRNFNCVGEFCPAGLTRNTRLVIFRACSGAYGRITAAIVIVCGNWVPVRSIQPCAIGFRHSPFHSLGAAFFVHAAIQSVHHNRPRNRVPHKQFLMSMVSRSIVSAITAAAFAAATLLTPAVLHAQSAAAQNAARRAGAGQGTASAPARRTAGASIAAARCRSPRPTMPQRQSPACLTRDSSPTRLADFKRRCRRSPDRGWCFRPAAPTAPSAPACSTA